MGHPITSDFSWWSFPSAHHPTCFKDDAFGIQGQIISLEFRASQAYWLRREIEEFRESLFGVSQPFFPPQLNENFNDMLLDPVFLGLHSFFTCQEKMEEFKSASIHLFAQPMVIEHRLCADLTNTY